MEFTSDNYCFYFELISSFFLFLDMKKKLKKTWNDTIIK